METSSDSFLIAVIAFIALVIDVSNISVATSLKIDWSILSVKNYLVLICSI